MSVKDINEYRHQVGARVKDEQQAHPRETDSGDDGPPIEFIRKCYLTNEVGDSILFNSLCRDKFVHNVISNDNKGWLSYVGPHWEFDYNKKSKAAIEEVAGCYMKLLRVVEQEMQKCGEDEKAARKALAADKKAIIGRLDRLRSDRGRNSVLSCAISNDDPLTVHPDDMDRHPWLLPVANGIIDLRTGEFQEHGDPRLYLTLASPTVWKGLNEPAPYWEKFLEEVLDGDKDVIRYLQKILGYSATGVQSERLFVVFHGPHGHNGKDTLIGAIKNTLGPLAGAVQTELLMSQKFSRTTSGPSPDLLALKGLRIAYAAETEKGHSFAAGQIKRFSGGNEIIGRGLQDREQTYFTPTHVLYLICNDLPSAPAKDSAFWERIRVFTFPWSFVSVVREQHHKPVDYTLEDKLKGEASGILAWLVRGCLLWQQERLIPPQKVIDDSQRYRSHEDDIQQFVDESCEVDFKDVSKENRVQSSALYIQYKGWWESGHTSMRGALSTKDFSDELQLKGFTKHKSGGKIYYQFIKIKSELNQGAGQ